MPPRFYVPEARADESTIELPEDEATHLTRVLRLSRGDHIRVFNGRGEEWDARVDETGKHRVSARLHARISPTPEPRISIVLALAVLKGDKMDDIVRDVVMLGVTAIVPIITSRTELSRAALDRSNRVARWQRIAVSSAKQCGRAVVPDVRRAATFEALIADTGNAVMLVEPSAEAGVLSLRDLTQSALTVSGADQRTAALSEADLTAPASSEADQRAPALRAPALSDAVQRAPALAGAGSLTLFVGPEGGWTSEEVQQARKGGAMLLTLGAQTLRADAVPVVALTAVRVRLEDF